MTSRNRFIALLAMFAIAWPNGTALATSIAQSTLEKPLTLTQGQQVIVDLRDGRQVFGAAGPIVEGGFNVFPAEGPPVFVGPKEFVLARDAATGAAVLLPTPRKMSGGTKGLIAVGVVAGLLGLVIALLHNDK